MLKSATTLAYRQTDQGPVQAHFFVPPDFVPGQRLPTLIFFHGGFWDTRMPTQFVPHCLHFASRGALAISVETRVQTVHGTGPAEALEDVRALLRWLAGNAATFCIDTDKVVLCGASGGAFLALEQVLPKFAPGDPDAPALTPRALVLFSALLSTTEGQVTQRFETPREARLQSPLRQVRRGLPPMLLFHGKNDRVTPFDDARKFTKSLRWRRNPVELVDFDNADHSFFNFNVSGLHYDLTLKAADRFLTDHGLLVPDNLVDF